MHSSVIGLESSMSQFSKTIQEATVARNGSSAIEQRHKRLVTFEIMMCTWKTSSHELVRVRSILDTEMSSLMNELRPDEPSER